MIQFSFPFLSDIPPSQLLLPFPQPSGKVLSLNRLIDITLTIVIEKAIERSITSACISRVLEESVVKALTRIQFDPFKKKHLKVAA